MRILLALLLVLTPALAGAQGIRRQVIGAGDGVAIAPRGAPGEATIAEAPTLRPSELPPGIRTGTGRVPDGYAPGPGGGGNSVDWSVFGDGNSAGIGLGGAAVPLLGLGAAALLSTLLGSGRGGGATGAGPAPARTR